jgi:acetyltransferase-like isoleucine patch superfamily enzyme
LFFDKFPFAGMPPQVGKNVDEIIIGNNVWTGRNVTIRKGVHIGDNSIIAAGAIVTRDIPANCVAGGIPAKPLKDVVGEDFSLIRDRVIREWPDYAGDAQDSW